MLFEMYYIICSMYDSCNYCPQRFKLKLMKNLSKQLCKCEHDWACKIIMATTKLDLAPEEPF